MFYRYVYGSVLFLFCYASPIDSTLCEMFTHIFGVKRVCVRCLHIMMTSSNGNISALLPLVRGIHRSPVNSPHKDQCRWALMFSLICARINGWVNDREAGDLRRYRAHYDVIVMFRGYLTDSGAIVSLSPVPEICTEGYGSNWSLPKHKKVPIIWTYLGLYGTICILN